MLKNLEKFMGKPELFAPGTNKTFWTEEHISKYLLEAYLDQNTDASSRKLEFIDKSVDWIVEIAPPNKTSKLLDLGCGAGLYAERFAHLGYEVTGMDFSKRAIEYAKEQSTLNKSKIEYILGDYLALDFEEEFDLITLIYCDLGALSNEDRTTLLQKAYKALKPSGRFILDVFTLNVYSNKKEIKTWTYFPDGGFWSAEPHLCLEANYLYGDARAELRQAIIQTDSAIHCYNVWEHYYDQASFLSEVEEVGFKNLSLHDDIAGKLLSSASETMCGVFKK